MTKRANLWEGLHILASHKDLHYLKVGDIPIVYQGGYGVRAKPRKWEGAHGELETKMGY